MDGGRIRSSQQSYCVSFEASQPTIHPSVQMFFISAVPGVKSPLPVPHIHIQTPGSARELPNPSSLSGNFLTIHLCLTQTIDKHTLSYGS